MDGASTAESVVAAEHVRLLNRVIPLDPMNHVLTIHRVTVLLWSPAGR